MRWMLGVFFGFLLGACSTGSNEQDPTLPVVDATKGFAGEIVMGQNGYAYLYTLNKSVPSSLVDAVLLSDVRSFVVEETYRQEGTHKKPLFDLDTFPSLNLSSEAYNQLCDTKKELSCLEQVNSHQKSYEANLDSNRILVQKTLDLNRFDYFASFFPDGLNTPVSDFKPLRYLPTASMVEFSMGHHDKGMDWACQSVQLGYKFLQSPDQLITNMVGASMIRDGSVVVSEMLAQRSNLTPPLSCQKLLSLSTSDTGQKVCQALQNEKRVMVATMAQAGMAEAGVVMGEPLDAYCQDGSIEEVNKGLPLSEKHVGRGVERHPDFCKKNKNLCLADDQTKPSYHNYGLTIQDSMMHLGVLQHELSSSMGNDADTLNAHKSRDLQMDDRTVSFVLYGGDGSERGNIHRARKEQ